MILNSKLEQSISFMQNRRSGDGKLKISKTEFVDLIEETLLHNVNIKSEDPFDPIKVKSVPKGWKCIGSGNYAAVFVNNSKNSDWVVKMYARDFEGLEKEAEVYEKMGEHPSYSKLIYKGDKYLVLKKLEGVTLYNALLKGIKIPPSVIEDVNNALEYARSRGLNPFDIHGKNVIMKDGKGYVVDISDFYKEGRDEKWEDLVKAYNEFYLKTLYKVPVKIPSWLLNAVRKSYRKYKKIKRKFN